MKSLNLLKIFNENFSVKAFIRFTILTVIISSSFTAFFILQQSRSLTDNLMKEGELLARLLAYNSRLGVFAENKDLLINSVEGILQRKEVLSASVFTLEGELLIRKERQERETRQKSAETDQNKLKYVIEKIKESKSSFHLEGTADTFEFWEPVISGAKYFTEESLFFDKGSSPMKETIGFVGVVLDKGMLNKQRKVLLFEGILMGIIFLMVSAVVVYLMVKRITRPLNKLTEGVKALGTGTAVERIPVETKDEIGRLASAFNTMAESLERKEAEKQQLEEQLRHTQKMEAIGILSGGIAHDFNNIMTGIIGYGNLIQMRLDKDNPLRHYTEQILASAWKAANLTQSLLAFSRKQIISPKPVDINEIIVGIEQLLARLVGENIEIRTRLADSALIVRVDIGQMEQVLMNLATNARDAMPDGGVLTIATETAVPDRNFSGVQSFEKTVPYAVISVTDTGVGMDAKTKERIFDPFFTTKEVGKGTGLGLSRVYGIIKQHGGLLNVYSELGKGTIFRISLPLIEAEIEKKKSKIHTVNIISPQS